MSKNKNNALGDRMKKYEVITRTHLIPKLYTIIRLDGKAFHTYTKQFKKPFDDVLINAMDETAKYLCSNIQGAKFAYVQSDEITIFISDMDSLEQQMWFDGEVQKIVSIAASMASAMFNHVMVVNKLQHNIDIQSVINMKLAEFDARVFQVPTVDELINCFIWRQQDCIRNSVSSVAQYRFSPKELHKKSTKDMKQMLIDINDPWENYTEKQKTGRFITKNMYINDIRVGNDEDDENERTDVIWYQPEVNGLYPSKHGRALQYGMTEHGWEDWCDIEIKKIRSKWESVACPELVNNKLYLKARI